MKQRQKIILIALSFFCLLGIIFLGIVILKGGQNLSVQGERENLLRLQEGKKSPFSGLPCESPNARAFAVDLAQYPETVPLSGLSQADIVIEGPVASPGGVTRLVTIFQCQSPLEIGSIRSVRPYMVDLALGFDTIFASWGGAQTAINRIKNLGLDWLDGRVNPANAFFRKTNIPAPHNGFTSLERLKIAMKNLGMRETNQFEGYQFFKGDEITFAKTDQEIKINYIYPVKYVYEPSSGDYLRFWNGQEMIDRNTSKQVKAKNVVILKTKIGTLSAGVVDVKIIGSGQATIYQAGKEIEGLWQKESSRAKLSFFNKEGREIKFVPGPIWIEITS